MIYFSFILCMLPLCLLSDIVEKERQSISVYDKRQLYDDEFCEFDNMECTTKPTYKDDKCFMLSSAVSDLCAVPSKLIDTTRDELRKIHDDDAIGNSFLCYTYNDNNDQHKVFTKWCESFIDGKCDSYPDSNDYLCRHDPAQYSQRISDTKRDITADKYPVRYIDPKYQNDILLAIDGTGSRYEFFESSDKHALYDAKYKSSHKDKNWIWQSHVANFAQGYLGLSIYWNGPDSKWLYTSGRQVDKIVNSALDETCKFIETKDQYNIDIIGFSRGGYAAARLASKLKSEGCTFDDKTVSDINVRFLGLYDPVKRTYEFTELENTVNDMIHWAIDWKPFSVEDKNIITANVNNVMIVERDTSTGSRLGFGYLIDSKKDIKNPNACVNNDCIKVKSGTSHGGIGGAPGRGDCKAECPIGDIFCYKCVGLYAEDEDKKGSSEADIEMRTKANNAGVPVVITTKDYYSSSKGKHSPKYLFVPYQIEADKTDETKAEL